MHLDAIMAALAGFVNAHVDIVKALVLGVVEGLTEFLPVSSTGQLLLMEHFLGWGDDAFGKSFAILIQLGAILALLTIYFGRLWRLALGMFTAESALVNFILGPIAVAGVFIGVWAHDLVEEKLFFRLTYALLAVAGGKLIYGALA